ncbi:GtrA family protein [Variovorax sp. dw_308]|uniref:GtrA family protein n=1 Tax=Variovorax sp. dw_308 TaxID=2721546 RepID=UPI001C438D81|nr:GtrA family protein [Variovorax sp. dw_308]
MKGARSFAWFVVAGVLGLVVDVVVLYVLAPLFGWYAARVLSFLAAATTTWLVNRNYAFADAARHASLLREYLGYLMAMLGGAAVNYTVYVLTLHWLEGVWVAALGVALGSLSGLTVNFLSARYLVFKAHR